MNYISTSVRCQSLFFFSSRRRHTRLQGDWSSDVCSSDLDHRLDRVSTQLLESRDALVTVNDQIAIRLIRMSDNDDRRLLSGSRQRRQQLSLPLRIPALVGVHDGGPVGETPASCPDSPQPDGATVGIWDCAGARGSVPESLAESVR